MIRLLIREQHGGVQTSNGDFMDYEAQCVLVQHVGEAGDLIQPLLPSSPSHPKGRNAYAHIWMCIRNRYGDYKLLENEMLPELMQYVNWLVANPS